MGKPHFAHFLLDTTPAMCHSFQKSQGALEFIMFLGPVATIRFPFALFVLAGAASAASAGTPVLFVDDDASPGGNGAGWATAFDHLQDALAAAAALGEAEIRVAGGWYPPDRDAVNPQGTGDRLASFHLLDGVRILGGHAGVGADPDKRDPARFPSVLSGDLGGNDDPADPTTFSDNAYHIVESWHNDHTAIIEGFTIRDGRADRLIGEGWWPDRRDDSGAGALLVHSDAVIRDCLFTANHAEANGALWIALSGAFAFAEPGGGALFISRGSPTMEGCVFDANTANRVGGGVGLHRSPARIVRCDFTNNRAEDDGLGGALGDMSADFATPERARIESCRFINNTALGSGGGGAVYTALTDSVYANCIMLANHAENAGGGVYADNGASVEFHSTAVVGNTATRRAAGVYEFSEVGDAYFFVNCIVWGNRCVDPVELNENMVSENGNIALYDTILEDGVERPVFAFDISRLLDADPRFTDTVGPDGVAFSGDEDLRPAPDSPAIDAGNSARVPEGVTTDLDAKPRFMDAPTIPDSGVGPAPVIDIGPFESGPGCTPADLTKPWGVLNFFDLAAYLDLYNAQDPRADLAPPFGMLNFFDLATAIARYNAGCP
jgi:predicted outer membrane repeat protein